MLGIVSFLTDVSTEAIYPLVPLFLINVLHTSGEALGLIEGVAESTGSILRLFSGWLSDKLGSRKWITTVGYTLSSVSKPLFSFAGSWPQVLVIRFADRLGKGIRSAPRDALIADVTPPESRGIAFGFHRALDTLGAVTGPFLAYLILRAYASGHGEIISKTIPEMFYRRIFLLSAVPALLSVAILILFVRDQSKKSSGKDAPAIRFSGFSSEFKRFLAVTVLFSIGNSSDVFLILRAQSVGISVLNVLLVYMLFNSVEALFSTAVGALSDKIGRKTIILVGYIVFALVYAGFGAAGNAKMVWLLFAAYGFYNALSQGVQRAFAADLTASNVRGTGMGAYQMLTGAALFPASLIAGILWQHNHSAPFFYGAATAVMAAILMAILLPGSPTYTDK